MRENPEQHFGKIITTIVTRALRLISLSISSNSLLDEYLQEFNQDRFPSLRALRLSDCHRIGAKGIKAIASQCPRLKYLDLHYSLNDEANKAALYIGEYLKELRCLNLHRTCNVLDSGLEAIAKGCPQLEYLELSRNYSLSDHSIKRLSENCHELKFLGMFYNTQVSDSGLKYLIENCPHFKFYHHGGWGQMLESFLQNLIIHRSALIIIKNPTVSKIIFCRTDISLFSKTNQEVSQNESFWL